jgi:tetratricopeptide (TPR) repeat protein
VNNKGKTYLVVLAVGFFGLSTQVSHAKLFAVTPHDLLPEQKIMIDDKEVPHWKALWDQARQSALQGDFETALRQYKALLELKSNLEEARWELARIMVYLKRWVEAAELLEFLIESAPESTLYINSLGKVMWELGQYERSVDLFRKVYNINPSDQTALAGLVEGLTKLDRKNEALPYLEQLSLQEPSNKGVRRYLAFLLYEAGDYEKARSHFTILSRNEDVELDVLYKTAKTYDRLGLEQQASIYWERFLVREPENIEAHKFLAQYFEKVEQPDRSLSHFRAVLAQNPEDSFIYKRVGKLYEKTGEPGKAVLYYEKYLKQYPNDPEVSHQIASINSAVMKKGKTRAPLQDETTFDFQDKTENLKGIIRNLEDAGRYEDTIPFYKELIDINPENNEILTALANDLIAIGNNKGNVSMLGFLSAIAAENISIYRSMAELLRRMRRKEELLAVLHKIHELDPGDNITTQELAILYLNRGEPVLSRKYFAELSESDCSNSLCLEARALLAEKLDLPAHRLQDYETLLKQQPGNAEIRFATIALAAQMGLLDTAVFHASYLQISPPSVESHELKVLLAEVYRDSGYLSRAIERYNAIIEQTSGKNEAVVQHFRIRSWLGMAESYEQLGLLYEAEQALRRALVLEENRIPILEALFHLFLRSGRIAESEIWLQALNLELDASQQVMATQTNLGWKKEFFQAEMYSAAGDYGLAVDMYRQAEVQLLEYRKNKALPQNAGEATKEYRIRTHLAAGLLQAREYAEAEQIVLTLKNSHAGELELLVLLEQIYLAWGQDAKVEKIAEEVREYAAQDFGRQLNLARLYRKYNEISRQSEAAEKATTQEPESLAAKHLLVDALIQQGEYFSALELLNRFLENYPDNNLFLSQQAGLLAKVGSFQDALAVTEMILAETPERRDIVLLQARILWEMNRWKDSLSLYETIVNPPVEELLERKIQEQRLTVDQSPTNNPWWEVITFREGTPLTISQVIMSPQQAADFSESGQIVNSVAAQDYALYRWQDRFNKELSVRRFVMRREYYHAANKLESYIKEFGSNDFLLYDLAGLYSKLERLNDEATLYRKIAAQNANFPGLSEAVQRNNLKRRPTIFLAYIMQYDDGWDGYMGVRQNIFQGGGKYYKTTNQEWNFNIARINYQSTRNAQNLLGWRTILTYDAKLSQSLGLSLAGGVEKLQSVYDDTPLWSGAFTGKIADEMRAVFSAKQDVVADTIASLKRNIKRRDYKIELMFDLFPRILLGGYYDLIDYSDSNWTHNYTFWASYIFWPEPTLLKISYNYDFYDSHEGQNPGVPIDDGFAPNDHPYWSPVNYWITRFSFYFKHQLSNDTLARGVPSYYAIEYSFGYDSEDNDLHEFKASLNFEIAKNYILSASYGFMNLDVYKHEEALVSLMYRF